MEVSRKPYQGVWNIIRFNWHFYVLSLGAVLLLAVLIPYAKQPFRVYLQVTCYAIIFLTGISLLVSYYIYDLSGLYRFDWIPDCDHHSNKTIINIHAGFDETSSVLKEKYNGAELIVLDFYNPVKHTEVSIKRAREAYPPYPGTSRIASTNLPVKSGTADKVFVIFAAHEIRSQPERIAFFNEVKRVTKRDGEIIIVEHLRDTTNFLAYNIGFLHFYSRQVWMDTFTQSQLILKKEVKHTPFISTFILVKDGN